MKMLKLKQTLLLFLALAINFNAPAQYVGADRIKKGSGIIADANNRLAVDSALIPTFTSDDAVLAVRVATVAVLPGTPTYANGAGGVGATLTRGSNGTLGTIDGITPFAIGDRILVKNQASQLENGIYEVTVVGVAGGGGTPYIITRTTDSDETSELDDQIVKPAFGTTNATEIFGQTTANPTMGTNNIVYTNLSGLYVTQAPGGTQSVTQIPYYTAVARRITKGESAFTYDPVTNLMRAQNISVDSIIDFSGAGIAMTATTDIFITAANSLGASTCQIANFNGPIIIATPLGGDITVSAASGKLSLLSGGETEIGGAAVITMVSDTIKVIESRFETSLGAAVTAANDLTLGVDGNVFHISGATQINAITTSGWQAGSEITFIFDSNPLVKNNTAGGAGTAVMILSGGDFSATANDVLKLVFDGTSWFEVSRSLN